MQIKKKRPTGFIATCQCGMIIGAMDYERTDRRDAGKIMGEWLADGCTVSPKFDSHWTEQVSACTCEKAELPSSAKEDWMEAHSGRMGG